MRKILFLICILFLVVGCDAFSPKPVTYHVYVIDKWCDTVEVTTTHFIHTGKGSIPICSRSDEVKHHVKFYFWNLEKPTSKMGNLEYEETVGQAYYDLFEKGKTYIFTEENEYELGLRSKEKKYKMYMNSI
jgi:hypothetical protein